MRSKFISQLFILIGFGLFGQSSDIHVTSKQKVIGQNLLTQQDISATEYQFPKDIYGRYLDSTSGNLTLQLRKLKKNEKSYGLRGELIGFNLYSNTVNWSRKINYTTENVWQNGHLITISKNNKVFYLDDKTGEELWNDKNDLYFADKENEIGIQYLNNDKNQIQGIDLKSGNVLWQRELSREYGWNETKKLNDSTILIASGGLHTLNLKNGKGWDYNTITGKKDYTETIAKNAAGLVLGALTGTAIISTGPNLVRNVASNILLEGDYIYFASKEKISKLNTATGEIIWSFTLDETSTSRSSLTLKDNMVYLINKGYANFGNRIIKFGNPFILALNSQTGKEEFMTQIDNTDNFILDYELTNDGLLLLSKDKIIDVSLLNSNNPKEKSFDKSEFGKLRFFRTNDVFTIKETKMLSLITTDATKHYIQTDKGLILELNNELEVKNQYNLNDIFFHYKDYSDYKFFRKGNLEKTVVCDSNNQLMADINLRGHIFVFGDNFYAIDGESLYAIKISNFKNSIN